jgi:phosphatidylglycerophosphate synthase
MTNDQTKAAPDAYPGLPQAIYQPASRRPIAGLFRRSAKTAVAICVRLHIHPDAISYASIVAAGAAAVLFGLSSRWPLGLLLAPLFCYLRLWFNMLDGMVAMASGAASRRGEILNDLPDRISDVIIFAGVAHSGWCNPFAAYWAAILALLTAYVGTFGQAVGGRREFGGIMSKPWRMVALSAGSWLLFALIAAGHPNGNILNLTCLIVILGCVQTIWVRLANIMRSLRK